ncbi:MAG: ribonuclease HI family protein [Candidatus Omnitrophota bacterium]
MNELEIYIDGASKGNPGPSGIGVVISREGETIENISRFIGTATNNVAEYTALIHALEKAQSLKAQALKINTDSQLLYKQVCKVYKIKSPNIRELYHQAQALMSGFKQVAIREIPREKNKGADKLATHAINEALKKNRSLKNKQAQMDKDYTVVKSL